MELSKKIYLNIHIQKEPDYDGAGRFIFRRISKSELRNLKFSMTRDFLQ